MRQFRHPEEIEYREEAIVERLESRVVQIERVINDHIRALHGPRGLSQFDDFGYREKLRYVLEMEVVGAFDDEPRMRLINII